MRRLLRACAAVAAFALPAAVPAGQKYPGQPVTIVVPYAPGGVTDVYGRAIGEYLGRQWKVPVIVKNESGGATMIGTQAVARAEPDGLTILLTSYAYTSNPILRKDMTYDKDAFRPVMLLGNSRNLLVTSGRSDLKTLDDVVAKARKAPGTLRLASSGMASSPHIAAELWAKAEGVKITHVPYRGTSPAMNDVFAGQVDGIFDGASAMPNVHAGRLHAIAIASEQRHPGAPEVPTFRELGVDLVFGSWFGFFVPKGTPDAIVDQLNADLRKSLADPVTRAAIDRTSLLVEGGSPQQFAKFLDFESERLKTLVKSGVELNTQ
ncbi:Bug family tripartite tricarboxylate transporter substrate binding protein [Bordetella genomosp. 13]|uniref:Bug family tripartite tricarboxylate transporter substrate binding protein n=1 Tax=Bordetella genomosp. 13 TaxID=463040 RepID=UPI00119E982A|nr:tripartite tricarboxylate transporter substrate binding protein [Bordetella genomosp. 13]